MKKIILVFSAIFLFSTSSLFAQISVGDKPEENVPVVVKTAFDTKFPNYKPVWFTSYEGRYNQKLTFEGRFIFDNRNSSAIYDQDGNLIAFAAAVEKKEIPTEALKYMNENFPYSTILDSILVTRGKNKVTYELGIITDGQYIIKVFSEKGDFIKSTRA